MAILRGQDKDRWMDFICLYCTDDKSSFTICCWGIKPDVGTLDFFWLTMKGLILRVFSFTFSIWDHYILKVILNFTPEYKCSIWYQSEAGCHQTVIVMSLFYYFANINSTNSTSLHNVDVFCFLLPLALYPVPTTLSTPIKVWSVVWFKLLIHRRNNHK